MFPTTDPLPFLVLKIMLILSGTGKNCMGIQGPMATTAIHTRPHGTRRFIVTGVRSMMARTWVSFLMIILIFLFLMFTGNITDAFMRTGSTVTNDISFTGGSQSQKFRVSYSDLRYTSPVPNSNMNRQTVNLSMNSKFGKKITLEARANYSTSKSKNRPNPQRYVQMRSLIPTSWDINWLKGETDKMGCKTRWMDASFQHQ